MAGFAYLPLSLYLVLPSYLLTGDVRYSQLTALALAALLLGYSGSSLRSKLAALVLLFSPVAFYLIQHAWTEPFVLLFFTAVLFCVNRGYSPIIALGLLLATKQYVVFAMPVGIWLLLPHRRHLWRTVLGTGLVAAAVSLPLVLWDLPAFLHSAVLVLFKGPFREDSLGVAGWLASMGYGELPWWTAFLAMGLAGIYLVRKLSPSPASFALSLAILYLLFFTFSRQAVLNYHVTVAACILGAVASMEVSERQVPAHEIQEETLPVAG
jgi:hypothetical protein